MDEVSQQVMLLVLVDEVSDHVMLLVLLISPQLMLLVLLLLRSFPQHLHHCSFAKV